MAERRGDLQLIRAWAVLAVIAHHARLPGLSGGFLGVDAFYVLSGFLMAGMIVREGFSLRGFYARRAHRLFPAAAATLLATAVAAPFVIDGFELRDLAAQMLGAVTFTANIVLWQQTDYFSSGAGLKPLLHMWSLAVEEQFYLVLPLALMLCPRRGRVGLLVAGAIASFSLCLWLQPRSPSATFYMLPTRAWEPLIGAVVALVARRALPRGGRRAGWAVLLVLPWCVDEAGHPGWAALAVCLATAVLVWPGAAQPGRWARVPVALGDRSYTLYLVHWPLIAFANNLWAGPVPGWARLAAVAMTFALGEAQYRWVERVAAPRGRRALAIGLAMVAMVVAAGGTWVAAHRVGAEAEARAPNMGLGYGCTSALTYAPRAACATGPAPGVLLWGDSAAMHLEPGLAPAGLAQATRIPGGVAQATRWVCGPLLGLAPVNAAYGVAWARGCLAWNRSVLASLTPASPVRVVVLSTAMVQYAPGAEPGWQAMIETPAGPRVVPRDREAVIAAFARTVAAIRATGRRVVIVGPMPRTGVDSGRCALRRAEGLTVLGDALTADCRFARGDWLRVSAPVRDILGEVARRGIAPVIDPGVALCPGALCQTTDAGVALYRDDTHLTVAGSRWLSARMGLAGMVAK